MIAPVVGSGTWPAWTARVPKPRSLVSLMRRAEFTSAAGAATCCSVPTPPDATVVRYDLDALEFAALRTPLGRSAAAALAPLPTAAAVMGELAAVAAVARALLAGAEPPLQGAVEV